MKNIRRVNKNNRENVNFARSAPMCVCTYHLWAILPQRAYENRWYSEDCVLLAVDVGVVGNIHQSFEVSCRHVLERMLLVVVIGIETFAAVASVVAVALLLF